MRNTLSKLTASLFLIGATMLFVGEAVAGECGSTRTCMTEASGAQTCIVVDKPCPPKSSTDTVHGSTDTVHSSPPPKETPPKKEPRKGSESTSK